MDNENYNETQEQEAVVPQDVVSEETAVEEPVAEPIVTEDSVQEAAETQDESVTEPVVVEEVPEEQKKPHFVGVSSQEYKQQMNTLKQEYKSAKKEEKKTGASGKAIVLTALITAVCTIMAICVFVGFISVFPSPQNNFLGMFINQVTGNGGNTSGEQTGGQFYAPNKETITIKDETDDVCTAVYAKVAPSIVGIRIVQIGGSILSPTTQVVSEGTGTVYSEDGLIITNYHVIEAALQTTNSILGGGEYEVRVYFDTTLQEYFVAEIIGGDSKTDLALHKINLTGLVPVEFADSDEILIGSDAIVMGGGGGLEFIDSVNKGIISGLHRDITTETGVLYDLIQTDAAINPGNSGGALLNSQGQLIGICFLKISADAYDNMAFAIPSNTVKNVISQIETKGSADTPYIGVVIDTTYSKQDSERFNYPMGALVSSVEEGKSADRAGIKKGHIITEFNGKKVTTFQDLRAAINSCQVGDQVTVKVFSIDNRKESTLKLTIDNYNSK